MKNETMKKANKTRTRRKSEMLNEYDFSKGVRGKYAKRYAEGSNVVVLSPDVAEAFIFCLILISLCSKFQMQKKFLL